MASGPDRPVPRLTVALVVSGYHTRRRRVGPEKIIGRIGAVYLWSSTFLRTSRSVDTGIPLGHSTECSAPPHFAVGRVYDRLA